MAPARAEENPMNAGTRFLMTLALASSLAAPAAAHRDGRDTSPEARQARRTERFTRMLKRLDENEDGRISQSEFLSRHELFDRLDADGDGVVTKDEARAAAEAHPCRGPRRAGAFDRLDADGDQRITLDEVKAAKQAAFTKLDADDDGQVERDEFVAFVPERRQQT
jgi:hypothetical protein